MRVLHDRLLVALDGEAGERRSSAGIVIPATASVGRRLSWARVVAVGGNVRTVEVGDRVLFDPSDRAVFTDENQLVIEYLPAAMKPKAK